MDGGRSLISDAVITIPVVVLDLSEILFDLLRVVSRHALLCRGTASDLILELGSVPQSVVLVNRDQSVVLEVLQIIVQRIESAHLCILNVTRKVQVPLNWLV